MDEKKIKHLEELIKLASNSLTKEEFVDAFKVVSDAIAKLKKSNEEEFTLMHAALDALTKRVKEDASYDIKELRAEVEMAVGAQIASIQTKLKEVKNGYTPVKGVDYFDGEDGVDAPVPTKQELIELIKPLIPEPVKGDKGDPGPSGNTVRVGWGAHPLTVKNAGVTKDKVARTVNFEQLTVSRAQDGVLTIEIPIQPTPPVSPFLGQLWIDNS